MANTYTKIYIHYVFSTKYRQSLIKSDIQNRLWAYIGGIARTHNIPSLAVGGIADHAHALISLPPTISVAKGIQLLKGGSSKWMNDHFFEDRSFSWQKGYGAFSVSQSQLQAVIQYINNQKEHHRTMNFREEYLSFLKRYNIEYDERYVFD